MQTTTPAPDPLSGPRPAGAGTFVPRLSEPDRLLLARISRGISDERIAEELHVSPETLRATVGRVVSQLGARNRTHAVTLALRSGQIT